MNVEALDHAFKQIPRNEKLIQMFLKGNRAYANYFDGEKFLQIVQDGQLELVKLILSCRPELLEFKDDYDQTALLWACARGHVAIVQILMDLGAELNVRTNLPPNVS